MKTSEFESLLRSGLHRGDRTVDLQKLARVRTLAGMALPRRRLHFGQLLLAQMRFLGWKLWTAQGCLLCLAGVLILRVDDRFFWESQQTLVRLLFCLSVLVVMMAIPVLCHSARCRMQEVETASYFSWGRLLLAKLAVIGLGDLALLGGIYAAAMAQAAIGPGSAAFYLVLPFLLSISGCLYLLRRLPLEQYGLGSMAYCAGLLLLGLCFPSSCLWAFQLSLTPAWLWVCGLLAAFCARQFRGLIRIQTLFA